MKKIYQAGIEARSLGHSKLANPYPYATESWAWWVGGWNDCDRGLV